MLFAGAEHHDFTGRLAFSWPQTAMPVTFDAAGKSTGAQFAVAGARLRQRGRFAAAAGRSASPAAAAAPPGSLFHAGHVTAPWSVFVADEGVKCISPPRVKTAGGVVAAVAASDGSTAVWNGTQSGLYKISGRAGDPRPQAEQGRCSSCAIASTGRLSATSRWVCDAPTRSAGFREAPCWMSRASSRISQPGVGGPRRFRCPVYRSGRRPCRRRSAARHRDLGPLRPHDLGGGPGAKEPSTATKCPGTI